jgi:hypothetical protein
MQDPRKDPRFNIRPVAEVDDPERFFLDHKKDSVTPLQLEHVTSSVQAIAEMQENAGRVGGLLSKMGNDGGAATMGAGDVKVEEDDEMMLLD